MNQILMHLNEDAKKCFEVLERFNKEPGDKETDFLVKKTTELLRGAMQVVAFVPQLYGILGNDRTARSICLLEIVASVLGITGEIRGETRKRQLISQMVELDNLVRKISAKNCQITDEEISRLQNFWQEVYERTRWKRVAFFGRRECRMHKIILDAKGCR